MSARTIGLPGVVLVLAGAALVLVSYRFLDWYDYPRQADSVPQGTFGALHDSADQLGGAGVAVAYFDWLAWVLLIATIVVGVGANVATPASDALRVAGFLVGLIGGAATYYALAQHSNATGSKHSEFYNSTWGLWAVLAGYLLAAIGAAIGPPKIVPAPRRRPAPKRGTA